MGLHLSAMCVAGGLVLLTHSHTIDSAELLLIEMSHSIMAMLALVAGWARWLEVRTEESAVRRAAAWIWPVCLVLVGVTLIAYREM